MRVTAFTRYGRRAASTRQRFEQYFPALRAAGIEVESYALLDDDYVAGLATGEPYPRRKVARAYADRLGQLLSSRGSDLFWVYAELLPFMPAWTERLATLGKPIVDDFDDAFFHSYDQSRNPLVRGLLGGKHAALLRRAAACCCGNAYVRDFAAQHCPDSVILPTVVDTAIYRPAARKQAGAVAIGWIGSPSTWANVRPLLPLLAELVRSEGVRLRVVGAGQAAQADWFDGMDLIEWTEAGEVAEVQAMDIGIMPLADRPFERGKSGYKLIQYMACGLPVVASPVGVNCEIVDQDTGFLASTEPEWRTALTRLIGDSDLRTRLGQAGRSKSEASYSLTSQAPRLAELLKSAARLRLGA